MIRRPAVAVSKFMPDQCRIVRMFGNDIDMANAINHERTRPSAIRLAMPPLPGEIDLLDNDLPGEGMIEAFWR